MTETKFINKYTVSTVLFFMLTYLGGIWQRPLFICEYPAILPGMENLPYFLVRVPYALAAMLLALLLGAAAGKSSGDREFGILTGSVFLLTPAVYISATVPGFRMPLSLLIGSALPWLAFLPMSLRSLVRNFRSMPPLCRNTGAILLAAGVVAGICSGWWIALFPALSWFFTYGLLTGIRQGGIASADRSMMVLSGAALSAAIIIFVIHISCRFGLTYLEKFRFYATGEFFAAPVMTLAVSAVWWRMAAKVEMNDRRKLIYFCVGAAFPLLALHGTFPYRVIRDHAPESFLRQSVGKVCSNDTLLIADRTLAPALKRVCRTNEVKVLEEMTPETAGKMISLRKTDAAVVAVSSNNRVKGMPPAVRRWRSGNFAVTYWTIPRIIIEERP